MLPLLSLQKSAIAYRDHSIATAFDVAADGTLSNKRLYFDGEKEYKEYFPEIFGAFVNAFWF